MTAVIGFPIRSDATGASITATGGASFETNLGLANLKTLDLSEVARTTTATEAAEVNIDLGATLYPIKGVALFAHNLTRSATIRVRGSSDVTFATSQYDSGTVNVYPDIYATGASLWGATATGNLTAQEYADGARHPAIVLPSSARADGTGASISRIREIRTVTWSSAGSRSSRDGSLRTTPA